MFDGLFQMTIGGLFRSLSYPRQVPCHAAISASRIQRSNRRFAGVTWMRNDGDTRGQ